MTSPAYKKNFVAIDWSVPFKTEAGQRTHIEPARSDLPFPMIIRDHIPPTLNHCDGRFYESATSFKKAVKEAGKRDGKEYEIVGDDPAFGQAKHTEAKPDPSLKHDIKQAYDRIVGV